MIEFTEMVQLATRRGYRGPDVEGHAPYPYQLALARDGLPDLLCVPTGAGKTLASFLPWLYRRRAHLDPEVRRGTPRRLVLVLPQRSLVEQTHSVVTGWLQNLAAADPAWSSVGVHLLLGGVSTDDRDWKLHPEQDAVFVGTQDMVLSRLLMRGYGEPRAQWPMSFGLLHADTQFVFDEVQLMGPGLPTSLQLAGLRAALGEAVPCRSMWMSATVDLARFEGPDFSGIRTQVELGKSDRAGPLRRRLKATRTVGRVEASAGKYAASLAAAVLDRHAPGTRTIVVLNTVDRAGQVYDAVSKTQPAARVVLLHSRFRPQERKHQLEVALDDPPPAGTVVIATQVLEAGVDVSSALLVTEVAPWSSLVQRAGRCNRAGEHEDARLLWVEPPPGRNPSAPYEDKDLARAVDALRGLEGMAVTSTQLQEQQVDEERPLHPVLRRRDLIDLFDTAPDLSGNDLDVSRWIRDADTITASVAWRGYGAAGPQEDAPIPTREELCPAPLGELRELLRARGRRGWMFDQVDGSWRPADVDGGDVRPSAVIVLDAGQGGYLVERGWAPASPAPVPSPSTVERSTVEDTPDALTTDPMSASGRPVPLAVHLEDVRREVAELLDGLGELPGLTVGQRRAAEHAGLLHDVGKAHHVFAASMLYAGAPEMGGPWAKSGTRARLRHHPSTFRHELVSALMALNPESGLLDGIEEPALVAYLVAAHHGKVRLSVRSAKDDDADHILGVERADVAGPVTLPDGHQVPELILDRDMVEVGDDGFGGSWTARACRLRDDLGPFRLAFLEAAVRVADWRASASYDDLAPESEEVTP
jgi:CRISPR-associated endonuclease/helicase Cas3